MQAWFFQPEQGGKCVLCVVGIINDFPSLVKAEKGDGRLVGGIVSGVPPEKKKLSMCVNSIAALAGLSDTITEVCLL